MKGIICYYSGSGNTKLACEYIKRHVSSVDFELADIVRNPNVDFDKYDFVGFACFADHWAPSQIVYSFFENIKTVSGIPAFVFNTYGLYSQSTLFHLKNLAKKKGFEVLLGHSLHTPESFPPLRAKKIKFDGAPGSRGMKKFDEFVRKLNEVGIKISKDEKVMSEEIKAAPFTFGSAVFSRKRSKEAMGKQEVDAEKCVECGMCQKMCPYGAIKLDPKPVFDHEKCFGCWSCYNHCPKQAIYAKNCKGKGQYPNPSKKLQDKLG